MSQPAAPDFLRSAPFHLDDAAMAWVSETAARLEGDARILQLFVIGMHGPVAAWDGDQISRLQPGGVMRFFSADGPAEARLLDRLQDEADIPLLVSADLEGSRMSLAFGTVLPNPLALAAVDDVALTADVSGIMAGEARAIGVNWSYTPVLDINAAFRSPIVATRGYGSDVDRIGRHALAQARAFQEAGVAACVKHWPGEGFDDRDQHLLTTVNPLSMDDWEERFGRLYRDAFAQDVLSVMSAHIALPSFVRGLDPEAGLEAFRPASLSHPLTTELLRNRLGFNGLIVSDASEMAGVTAFMAPGEAKAEMLRAGCDMILFSSDMDRDLGGIKASLAAGRLSRERLDEALWRVLGLKAALGLHEKARPPLDQRLATLRQPQATATATSAFERAPTLVKDVQGVFPLSPERHRKVLFVTTGVVSPLHGAATPMVLPELMRQRGFAVDVHAPDNKGFAEGYDLVLYALGEETLLTRGRIFLDWLRLMGDFRMAMKRPWHEVPTAMVSFGYPYYLYDAPRMPAYVNAYCTSDEMQAAALDCMMGLKPFAGNSPVDPFCGLEDARY
ncbi:MAG: glycoside hydrolase family 3 protein [Devosia sp.]|uniref:glycoside hydrolase family 3 protein n=1 Tax=Devosia sp. TaxID=1871048 RepID=UPI0024CBD768|nr:glycoside hydrolase family 3 N-terminal domain-containing protein [Devosia sp.]UYN98584.1 MAG: glycoside hydrolase family 3 protein [Devosia sp.]